MRGQLPLQALIAPHQQKTVSRTIKPTCHSTYTVCCAPYMSRPNLHTWNSYVSRNHASGSENVTVSFSNQRRTRDVAIVPHIYSGAASHMPTIYHCPSPIVLYRCTTYIPELTATISPILAWKSISDRRACVVPFSISCTGIEIRD